MKKFLAYFSLAALVLTGCAGSRSDDPEAGIDGGVPF